MLFTSRRGISYPDPDRHDTPDFPLHLKNVALAADVDATVDHGLLAARPVSTAGSPGLNGRFYYGDDTGHLYYDYGTGWLDLSGGPVRVTAIQFAALTPIDGMEVYLRADDTNGVLWHLRYNAGSSSAYKWEYLGGPPIYASVDDQDTTSSTSFADLPHLGPAITLPRPGDYDVSIGYTGTGGNTGAQGNMSYAIGATAASAADQASVGTATGGSLYAVARAERKTGLAAVTLTAKYDSPSGASATFANRQIRATPVRIS